jgi:hypothetical protein
MIGATLGAILPALNQERTAFSLDQPPGFSLLSSDAEEDL